ncbi:cyclin-like protein [Zopfochytrium polystomum]|nr:cyclin-like protein [Zopfochytrium polystomum]
MLPSSSSSSSYSGYSSTRRPIGSSDNKHTVAFASSSGNSSGIVGGGGVRSNTQTWPGRDFDSRQSRQSSESFDQLRDAPPPPFQTSARTPFSSSAVQSTASSPPRLPSSSSSSSLASSTVRLSSSLDHFPKAFLAASSTPPLPPPPPLPTNHYNDHRTPAEAAKSAGLAIMGNPIFEQEIRVPFYYTRDALRQHLEGCGVRDDEEISIRRTNCGHLRKVCERLGFPFSTTCAALLMLHRFFSRNSLHHYDYEDVMATCVLVACKVQETVKKIKDIISAFRLCIHDELLDLESDVDDQKRQIFQIERVLLETLSFDFTQIQTAHSYVIKLGKNAGRDSVPTKEIVRKAWQLADESYNTTVCVQYPPHVIAVSCLYLAGQMMGEPLLSTEIRYISEYHCEPEAIQDICLQVLEYLVQDSTLQMEEQDVLMKLHTEIKNQDVPKSLRFLPPLFETIPEAGSPFRCY